MIGYALIGFCILVFGLISGRAERGIISPAMAFVVFGYLASALGILPMEYDHQFINLVATLALILILFTDASRIDLRLLWKEHDIPIRLLGIGLPLTIVAGSLVGIVFFGELSVQEAVLLAIILAPTDAALGQAVVCSPLVPVRIRQALNIESGLNDGIALPFLLIALALATSTVGVQQEAGAWVLFAVKQIGLGPVAGIGVGYLGAKMLQRSYQAGWVNVVFLKLSAVGLAILAFGAAELVHGNGFIAAFSAGLIMGNVARDICHNLHMFGEAEGQLLALLTFMIFGGLMLPEVIGGFDWIVLVYALLSLTVIRLIPVAVSMIGLHLRPMTLLFVGWFGPRGIASILYVLLMIETADLPGLAVIKPVVVLTILLSVFLHGVTANPAARAYAKSLEEEMPEMESVPEMPLRLNMPKERMRPVR